MTNLYRTETILDEAAGSIIAYVPVVLYEDVLAIDNVRQAFYKGQIYVNGQPILFKLAGTTFSEAINNWPAAVQKALEDIQRVMRERKSSLILRN